MANGEEALTVLEDEINAAISDIKACQGSKTCDAHGPMARGLIVLLRCQKAHIGQSRKALAVAGVTGAGAAALITALLNWAKP